MTSNPSRSIDTVISYSRADQALAEAILSGLRARGLTVWYDKDIAGGALWEEQIARNYRAAKALLFFVSRSSLESGRCAEEVSTARTLGKPIIPVVLDQLKLPDDIPDRFVLTLQARNAVDASSRNAAQIEDAILRALQQFGVTPSLDREAAPAPVAEPPRPAVADRIAPPASAPAKKNGALIAFGGLALAAAAVLAAYFMFTGKTPSGGTVTPTPAEVAAAPKPTAAPTPKTTPAPPSKPTAAPSASPVPTEAAAPSGAPTLTLDKTWGGDIIYIEGEPINVKYSGLKGDETETISIAVKGAAKDDAIEYQIPAQTAGELAFKRIMKAGEFELRLQQSDANGNSKTIVRVPFGVVPMEPPVELSLKKNSVAVGEAIHVHFKNMLSNMYGTSTDWISVTQRGNQGVDSMSRAFTDQHAEGDVRLPPVMLPGDYEVRAYFAEEMGDYTVRAAIPITVTDPEPITLTPDAETYAPGDDVLIAYEGMPGNDTDWICISETNSDDALVPDRTYVAYTSAKKHGQAIIKAPPAPGIYEVRAYFADETSDRTVRARASIEVVASEAAPAPPDAAPQQ